MVSGCGLNIEQGIQVITRDLSMYIHNRRVEQIRVDFSVIIEDFNEKM